MGEGRFIPDRVRRFLMPVLCLIAVGAVLLLFLSKRLWYRWYTIEQTLMDLSVVSAETEFEIYAPDDTAVKITMRNHSSISYEYLEHLTHAERFRDGQWMYWSGTPIERRACDLLYHGLSPGGTVVCEVSLLEPPPFCCLDKTGAVFSLSISRGAIIGKSCITCIK